MDNDKLARMQEIVNRGVVGQIPQDKQAIINELLKRGVLTQPSAMMAQGVDPDVPTPENMAADYVKPDDNRGFLEKTGDAITGAGEAGLTMGTGATAGTLGYLSGAIEGIGDQAFGEGTQKDTFELANKRAAAATYTPKTKEGQEIVNNIAKFFGGLPPVLGSAPISSMKVPLSKMSKAKISDISEVLKTIDADIIKNPDVISKLQDVLPPSIKQSPRTKRAIIAEQIRTGSPNTDMVTKSLSSTGDLITNKTSKRALKVLTSAVGDVDGKKIVSAIENMTPQNKSEVSRMLKIVETGRKNAVYGDINRPSDVLGDVIGNRAKDIYNLNRKAGEEIGGIAKSIKENVDISQPTNKFMKSLSEMGVTFKQGDDGWLTPDFSRSKFKGGNKQDITVLINELMDGSPTFEKAHKLKQEIRDNVSYDIGGAGQLKGQSEILLKDLSREINDNLVVKSNKYAKANQKFAETVKLKEDFDKLAGKDIDIFSDVAPKSLGTKARRITSYAESRAAILQLLNNSESVLAKNGIRYKTDVNTLAHVVGQIEKAFKLAPKNSLKGNMVTVGADVLNAAATPTGIVAGFGRYLEKLTTPDYNKTMRAFRSLTEQGTKK